MEVYLILAHQSAHVWALRRIPVTLQETFYMLEEGSSQRPLRRSTCDDAISQHIDILFHTAGQTSFRRSVDLPEKEVWIC